MRLSFSFVAAAVFAAGAAGLLARKGDLTHQQAATQHVAVDFGVLPTGPLGPPPGFQSGAIGGSARDNVRRPVDHLPVPETGRYLVVCMNRSHFLNDWMFGFVNVTGK